MDLPGLHHSVGGQQRRIQGPSAASFGHRAEEGWQEGLSRGALTSLPEVAAGGVGAALAPRCSASLQADSQTVHHGAQREELKEGIMNGITRITRITRITHIKTITRSARLTLAALITTSAAIGGVATFAGPASASPITPIVSACLSTGSIGWPPGTYSGSAFSGLCHGTDDFSYTSTGQQEARNVVVSADDFPPNTTVQFGWRDATVNGPWNDVPAVLVDGPNGSYLDGFGTDSLTGIPRSACGHTLQVSATGQVWQGYGYTSETGYATIAENCGPMVGWSNGVLSGDGFTAGGNVQVYVVQTGKGEIYSQVVPATKEAALPRCFRSGLGFVCDGVLILTPPGEISVSNLPVPTGPCGQVTDTYTARDSDTGSSVSFSETSTSGCPE